MRTADPRFRTWPRNQHGTATRRAHAFYDRANGLRAAVAPPTTRSTRSRHPLNQVESLKKGTTLRTHVCESWKNECAELEFTGRWKTSFPASRMRATLNRYVVYKEAAQAVNDLEIDANSSGSNDPMIAEITSMGEVIDDPGVASEASLSVLTKGRNVMLHVSDPVPSEDPHLRVTKCTEIEGNSFKQVKFLSLRPTDSTITVDTSSSTLKIKSLDIECDKKDCHFRILAEGKITKLEQNGARLWPEE